MSLLIISIFVYNPAPKLPEVIIVKAHGFVAILGLIAAMTAVGQIANTIYVPAMVSIASHFSLAPSTMQILMAAYLIPYGSSQFFYGPLTDKYGRRPITLIGISIFTFGAAIAALSTHFFILVAGCLVQGLGIGVVGVMCRTVARDLYSGRELHRAASYVSGALIIAPLAAPVLGGILTAVWGWRANFIFLFFYAVFVLIVEYAFLPETNSFLNDKTRPKVSVFKNYGKILENPQFIGNMVCLIAAFSGISVFESCAGILLTNVLHYSLAVVGLLFIIPLPAYCLGSFLTGRFNHLFSAQKMMFFGVGIMGLASFTLLVLSLTVPMTVWTLLVPITCYLLGVGIISPTATSGALQPFPQVAGTASALLGGMQNLGAGFFTVVSALLPQHTAIPLSFILTALTLMILFTFFKVLRSSEDFLSQPE